MPGDQFGITTQGSMGISLVTDEDVGGLGFYAEITVSDAPPDVLDNDLQCKYTPLNTIAKSESFRAKQYTRSASYVPVMFRFYFIRNVVGSCSLSY